MGFVQGFISEYIPLQFFPKINGVIVDQPSGYPTITINRVNSDNTFTEVLSETVMSEGPVDGEYVYNWSYSIEGKFKVKYKARIDGADRFAYDELYLIDKNIPYYLVVGVGNDRFDASINNPFTLECQVYKNGVAFDVFSAVRVQIFNSKAEAEKPYGTGIPIQTITTINRIGVGKYNYSVSAKSTAQLYWDKFYYISNSGESERSEIMPVYVRKTSAGATPPGPIETANIELNLFDFISTAQRGDIITVIMSTKYAWYNNELIENKKRTFEADNDGIVMMELTETDTLGVGIHYIIDVAGVLKERVRIPKGTISANYKDLPRV